MTRTAEASLQKWDHMAELQGFQFVANRLELESAPLLLFHGSNQDERKLVPLADQIARYRPYVALRGQVAWEDGFAFFRRRADRTLDDDDLAVQTQSIIRFVEACLDRKLFKQKPILVGFSNGAIMAASILLRRPRLVSGAVLIRPLSPAPAAQFPDLVLCPVLITSGDHDPRRVPDDAPLLEEQLRAAGACVTAHNLPAGHDLHCDEPDIIQNWLQTHAPLASAIDR